MFLPSNFQHPTSNIQTWRPIMQPKIAINLYSLRTFCTTPEDIAETLKKVSAIGYEYVQLSGLGPIDPTQLKAAMDAAGVKACATHVSWDRLKAEPDYRQWIFCQLLATCNQLLEAGVCRTMRRPGSPHGWVND